MEYSLIISRFSSTSSPSYTMSDKFAELKAKYTHQVPAEALFINAGHKALRLECPEIGKEFTDHVYIGKGGHSFISATDHANIVLRRSCRNAFLLSLL